ncbi:MAG: short-chain fatty acids transporter [Phycisphaeraceae bacterium]|nr:MAG: short-chain fatty acids transporter [Phycisphaeraceae bacterium]
MLVRTMNTLGARVSAVFNWTAPDPFVLAILLTLVAALLALTLGDFPGRAEGGSRVLFMLDRWRGGEGIWKWLGFGMQMCLVLVTGHALAASRPVRAVVRALASLPRSGPSAAALVGVVAAMFGLLNWGLGLIVGALFARDVARALEQRGVRAHYPVLAAAGYMGMLVWHGGLSGSAPLTSTTRDGAAKVLPTDALAQLSEGAGIALTETIFSPLNLIVSVGLLVLIPLVLWLLCPRSDADVRTIAAFDVPLEEPAPPRIENPTLPDRLHHTPVLSTLLALVLGAAVVRYGFTDGLKSVGLNEINAAMLALGLLLHGSTASYVRAAEDGARGCAGVILQFPLYAGIMGILAASGLIALFSNTLARLGGESTLPVLTFASAGIVNFFVPSGGGQWGIQGPIALEAGAAVGVAPGKMIMAVAYGDQLTNMLQPFWALPLLAITGVKARDIVGYTAIVMLVAAAWMALWLLVF